MAAQLTRRKMRSRNIAGKGRDAASPIILPELATPPPMTTTAAAASRDAATSAAAAPPLPPNGTSDR